MGVCGQYVLMQTLFMNRIEDFMKKIFRQIHLWLSVPFGLIISLICFSGAMLVFENEVMELVRHELYYVKKVETVSLPVDRLLEEVELMLPDSVSVTGINVFSDPERAWQVNLSKPRRAFMYVDQYTGEIKGKYERPAFFVTMFRLHRWLLDSMKADGGAFWGKMIVGVSTLLFVVVLTLKFPNKQMEKIHVLLVEDEQTLAMIIKDTLEEQDFIITTAGDGEEGLRKFFEQKPDVLVADVMMPRMDGFEMVRRIRQSDKATPVLFLTARSAINDVVKGFELGANDYLKKPFGMQELIVRLKALMHKAFVEKEITNTYTIGGYQFNSVTQQLDFAGNIQELSHRESEILKRLCENRNEVVNSQSILLELWGDDSFFNSRSLHVFITKLRHKLSKDQSIRIVNVRGIGYKLIIN